MPGGTGSFFCLYLSGENSLPDDKLRVSCFIDGFNLYHAIHELGKNYLKWVNYFDLASAFIKPSREELVNVYYFSAFPNWNLERCNRHKQFKNATESQGVKSIISKFKRKQKFCKYCNKKWWGHEEKETDVQIALHMVRSVVKKECDKIFLLTSDSDLIPAIKMIKELSQDTSVTLLIPPGRKDRARELISISDQSIKISEKHLRNNLLPKELNYQGKSIHRPEKYEPLSKIT